jgi:phosphopantothenoylcysteine decarboxylase / phosphopantothenate---cysteine ligase
VERLDGMRVLLGVSGGIAAYKAALLTRLLVGAGATVDVVLTRGAERFIGPTTFEGLTGRPVRTEVWQDVANETHVALGRAADVAVVYPATAHVLAKLAGGLADDLLTTTLLAATCPVVVAPAMHTEMWQHAATSSNVEVLRGRGVQVVGPDDGSLMGGDRGPGRLVEPDVAFEAVAAALAERGGGDRRQEAAQDLAGQRVLVTAGGTREPIDPVRYLGNRSSGKMGFALAEVAAARGASVVLVTAPTSLPTPPDVERVDVTTALDMHEAVFERVASVDVIVKAAAVADFRPSSAATSKLKKDAGAPAIELVPNPDILAELGARREGAARPVLVGFAAETDDVEAAGLAKLERKGCDLLVVNDVSANDAGFEVDTNRAILLDRDGGRVEVPLSSKAEVAQVVLDAVAARLRA